MPSSVETCLHVLAVLGALHLGACKGEELPRLGAVPELSLTDHRGAALTATSLRGRPWIANFIFTRCQGICPVLSNRMADLLRRLERAGIADMTAVSFSVDPEHDDPATLRAYAERFEADPERWLFLTGPMVEIERVVRDGFRLSIAALPEAERRTAPEPITHSDRFVLVDAQLRIRGYYHGTEDEGLAALERDLHALR
jgi:protein SCO1/2